MGVETIIAHLKATARKLTGATALDVSIVDGSGNQVTSFGGSGGTSAVDESAFTVGSGQGTPVMGIFESSPSSLTNGQVGLVGLTATRQMKVSGSFSSAPITAGTNTLSSVAENAASTTVLAANANRLAFTLYNGSNSPCYIKFGAGASPSSFIKRMLPGELFGTKDAGVNYTGLIAAIWDTTPGTGAAAMLVNEMTT